MSETEADRRRWQEWADEACAAVGVDPAQVDIRLVHALTKHVAHRLDRPLAPVSSYILGLAVAQGMDAAAAYEQLLSTLPTRSTEQ